MAVGDIYEARFFCRFADQTSVNVRHWRVSAQSGAIPTAAAIALRLSQLTEAEYKAVLSIQAEFRGVGVRQLVVVPKPAEALDGSEAGNGTSVGDALPGQVAGLISLRTNFAGRSGRGRVYIPFPTEAQNDVDGEPTLAYIGNAQNLAAVLAQSWTLVAGTDSTTFQPIVWNRKLAQYTIITSSIVRTKWATQRRRGDFGRPNVSPV